MSSLQEIVYKQLPQSIKQTITRQKETYPEYNEVISRINLEILSRFKTKVKLTQKEITLTSILLSIYYHVKNNPPENFIKKKNKKTINVSLNAWQNFVSNNYPAYNYLEDYVEQWPKFMFLLFHTYIFSYNNFYNLKNMPFLIKIPNFNKKTTKFISYIYNTYKYLDTNTTLIDLRDWGY